MRNSLRHASRLFIVFVISCSWQSSAHAEGDAPILGLTGLLMPSVDHEIESLHQEEETLIQAFEALKREVQIDTLRQIINEAPERVWSHDPADRRRRIKASPVEKAFTALKAFEEKLDAYYLKKLNFLIQRGLLWASQIGEKKEAYKELKRLEEEWKQHLAMPVKFKASERNRLFRSFVSQLAELLRQLENEKVQGISRQVLKIHSQLRLLLDQSFQVLSLIRSGPELLDMLYRFFRPHTQAEVDAYPPTQSRTPYTASLGRLLRKLSRLQGLGFDIQDPHKALQTPRLKARTLVRLIVPTHRDIYLDPAVMAHLIPEGFYIFVAHERYVPFQFVQKGIHANPDFLCVSDVAGESTKRLDELVARPGVHTIVIYPEGTTSLLGESSPLATSFSVALLPHLLAKKDVEVELVPVTASFEVDIRAGFGQRFRQLFSARQKRVEVRVEKPLDHQSLLALVGPQVSRRDRLFLSSLLRFLWLQALPTNEGLMFGQVRASKIFDQMKAFLGPRSLSGDYSSCLRALEVLDPFQFSGDLQRRSMAGN